jgi:hypothetical protein
LIAYIAKGSVSSTKRTSEDVWSTFFIRDIR